MRRTMVRSIIQAIVGVGVAAAGVAAQEVSAEGFLFDSVRLAEVAAPRVKCVLHPRYIVVEEELTDALGADLFIRARDTGRCDADSLAGDYVVRNDWAEYFMGLRGDVLFIDSGSGSDFRDLIVIDLATRRKVLQRSYVEVAPGPDAATLGVWDGYELTAPAAGCAPPPGGLLPGLDSLFFVDIRTGDARFGGQTRCANRQ